MLNDLIVSEYENEDEIYVVRESYEEYVVGRGIGTDGTFEKHVMTLSEALAINLKDLGTYSGAYPFILSPVSVSFVLVS